MTELKDSIFSEFKSRLSGYKLTHGYNYNSSSFFIDIRNAELYRKFDFIINHINEDPINLKYFNLTVQESNKAGIKYKVYKNIAIDSPFTFINHLIEYFDIIANIGSPKTMDYLFKHKSEVELYNNILFLISNKKLKKAVNKLSTPLKN